MCCVSKRGNNIVSQPEAGENEQTFATCQLREPKGIPNDDQTEQKSPIGKDRVAKLALTRREWRQYVKCPFSHKIRNLRLIGDWRGGGAGRHKIDNYDFLFVPINLQSGYISIFIMANWFFRFNLIDMH